MIDPREKIPGDRRLSEKTIPRVGISEVISSAHERHRAVGYPGSLYAARLLPERLIGLEV